MNLHDRTINRRHQEMTPRTRRDIYMVAVVQAFRVMDTTGRQVMQTPEDVAQMLRLKAAGLGIKSIARKMGCSKNTVRRYLRSDGWVAYKPPERKRALREFGPWLAERLQQH